MKTIYSCTLLICVILLSCSDPVSLQKEIEGEWKMHKVYDGETDATKVHNPEENRWIRFDKDGTFESGGDPYGPNSGKWRIDQEKAILLIDSDVDDDDSEWHITIAENKMTWTGIGDPGKEGYRLIHIRK